MTRLPHRLDADPGRTRQALQATFVLADIGPHISCAPTGTRHRLTRRGEHARHAKDQVRSRFHRAAVGKAAYAQLWLARHLATDLRRPWEKPAQPGRLTPARVRRGFRHLRQATTRPARAPKPSRPGPGRPKGSKNKITARRPEVGKTIKRDTTLKERQARTG